MNCSRNPFAVLAFAQVILATQSLHSESPTIDRDGIKALVQPYLDGGIVNAVSIGVVRGDQTWTGHFGRLSDELPKPPTDSTLYEIGSISKVFTGLLLAGAVEAERVDLDQPIGSLMTELQTSNREVGDAILLRHLSTHMSGLPRMPDNVQPADPTNPYADYDRKRLTKFMCQVRPARQPGESSEYSNLAAGLLGDLLAAHAGESYEELLTRSIAEPLEMIDTCLSLSENQEQRLAPPHNADRAPDRTWEFDALAGAGGIRSTTMDMLRFMQANLNPPDSPLGRAIDLAWKQHLAAKGEAFAMGLGWHIARDGQTRWHNGQTGGYHSMMLVNRQIDGGVVVLCNTALGEIDALAESIIQSMAGIKVKPAEFPKPKSIPTELVSRMAGRYQITPGFDLTVRPDGDKLFVQATNQQEFRVYPESETEWKYRIVDASLTFEIPDEGNCAAVTLHQNGQDMRAPRVGD